MSFQPFLTEEMEHLHKNVQETTFKTEHPDSNIICLNLSNSIKRKFFSQKIIRFQQIQPGIEISIVFQEAWENKR